MTLLPLALALPLALSAPPAGPGAPPLTLDDALAEAAAANLDLRLARNAREAAAVDVYGSYSGVLPRLDLSASAGRDFVGSRSSVEVVPILDPVTGAVSGFDRRVISTPAQDEADYALGVTLRQPVFDGLASWRRIAAAQAGERAAERQVDESGLAVAFEVTRLFYGVVLADESLRVLEETVRRSEEVLVRQEALFEAGRAPVSEVIAARVNLENDRLRVETQRAQAGQTRASLAAALGREATGELDVVPPATVTGAPQPGAEPPPVDVLVARARARRPLLAAQDALVTQSQRNAAAARGAFWPVLSIQAAYSRQGPELAGADGVLGDPTRQYVASAQLVLSWNLFAGRETTANARQAELAVRQAEIEADRAHVLVAGELAAARATATALARAIGVAQAALAAAEEGQRAARERFEVGVANQLEVRDAELKLTQARLALLQSRVDEAVARADLARAVGGPL
jgi:outer membrane protein TolC